jgi:large repetitive protein
MALNLSILSSVFQDSASGPGFADIGEQILYTFQIRNTGPGDLTGITFSNPNIAISPTFNGNLANGEAKTVTGLYTLQAADLDNGRVVVTGLNANGTAPTGLITSNPINDTENLTVRASLAVTKTPFSIEDTNKDNPPNSAGDTIVYQIDVKNTSPRTAFNVILRDFPGSATVGIPVTLTGLTDEPGDADAGVANDLAIGGTATGFFNYIIQQSDLDEIAQGNTVQNRATATGTTKSNAPISGTATTTIELAPNPDFTIEKIAGNVKDAADAGEFVKADGTPGTGLLGEKIKYKYLFKNTGNVTLNNVTATDDKITGSLTFDKTTLLPGETAIAEALGDVTQDVINAGAVTNTVTGTATPPSGIPLEPKQDDETVTVAQNPNFTIEKIAGNVKDAADAGEFVKADGTPGTGLLGEKIKYKYLFKNTGNVTLTNVTATDDKITGALVFDKTTLLPGETAIAEALGDVTQTVINTGSVKNTVTATATPPSGTPLTPKQDDETVTVAQNPNFTIEKIAGTVKDAADAGEFVKADGTPGTGLLGEKIKYKYLFTNTGNVTLINVTATDDKITGPLVFDKTTLLPGETATADALGDVTQAVINTGSVKNTVTATATPPSGTPLTPKQDDETVTVAQNPNFTIEKIAGNVKDAADAGEFVKADGTPGTGLLGEKIKYKYLFTNTGNVTLTNVTATDDKITGPLVFDKTTLLPGESAIAEALGDVTQTVINTGSVKNTVTATATPPSGTPLTPKQDDETVVLGQRPDFTIEKIAGTVKDAADAGEFVKADGTPGTGLLGEKIKYKYLFTNTGNVTLTNVTATDDKITGALVFDKTTLLPGETATAEALGDVTQVVINTGSVKNTVTATATPPSGTPLTPKQDDETVVLGQRPDFTIEKIAGNVKDAADAGEFIKADGTPGTGLLGEKIKYTYKFTNTGNVTLTNVTATDDKALPLPGTLTFDKTTLLPGEFATATYLADVTQALINAGSVKNIVTATATPPTGTPLTPKQDDETVILGQKSDFTIVKTAGNIRDAADAGEFIDFNRDNILGNLGDQIKYTYLFTNTGNTTLTNVRATDDKGLPGGTPQVLTFDKTTLLPGEFATATYLAEITPALVTQGFVKNTVTATAKPPTGPDLPEKKDDETVTLPPPPVAKPPELKLIKTAGKIHDNDCDHKPSAGDTVTYTYEIINTGPVDVFNLVLKDDNGTPNILTDDFVITNIAGLQTLDTIGTLNDLGVGKKAVGYYTKTLTAEDICNCYFTNVGTVTGFSATGEKATASDDETIVFCPPQIHLEKCAELDLGSDHVLNVGDVVKYSFHVSNTGSIALNNIFIDDPMLRQKNVTITFANGVTSLAPGECVDAVATYRITQADIDAGSLHNVATVYGNPIYGKPNDRSDDVKASAEASICLPQCAEISIDKVTVYGNQKGEYLRIPVGSAINWEYTITNKGNVSLRDIALNDQLTGAIAKSNLTSRSLNNDDVLDVGETWLYKVTGRAIEGDYCSDGTVTGYYTDCDGKRQSASATDWNDYIGYKPKNAGYAKRSADAPAAFNDRTVYFGGSYQNGASALLG